MNVKRGYWSWRTGCYVEISLGNLGLSLRDFSKAFNFYRHDASDIYELKMDAIRAREVPITCPANTLMTQDGKEISNCDICPQLKLQVF
jgi:hypothetical protein